MKIILSLFCLLSLLLNPFIVFKALASQPLETKHSLEWLTGIADGAVFTNFMNPNNTTLALPDQSFYNELRPNLKFTTNSFAMIVKPRIFTSIASVTQLHKKIPIRPKLINRMIEGYCQWTVDEKLSLYYGLQNFQWGGAELISPSNPIIHETIEVRNNLYESPGNFLARVHWSWTKNMSTIFVGEFQQNFSPAFIYNEPFHPTMLLKNEWIADNGIDYVGVVFGGQDKGTPFLGEYFQVEVPFLEGLGFYGDMSQQRGLGKIYYPQEQNNTYSFSYTSNNQKELNQRTLLGLRFSFITGDEIHVEHYTQNAGYSGNQYSLYKKALTSQNFLDPTLYQTNLQTSWSKGLDLLGQSYTFASLRLLHPFSNNLVLYFRYLFSHLDHSSDFYGNGEYNLSDSAVGYLGVLLAHGENGSELHARYSRYVTVGMKRYW